METRDGWIRRFFNHHADGFYVEAELDECFPRDVPHECTEAECPSTDASITRAIEWALLAPVVQWGESISGLLQELGEFPEGVRYQG